MPFAIIVATDKANGIGKDGQIPWDCPLDMRFFRYVTTYVTARGRKNAVIMGRKTWESLGCKPLKGRVNIVLSRTPNTELPENPDGPYWQTNLEDALEHAYGFSEINAVYVIGGAAVYKKALVHSDCAVVYHTQLDGDFSCDRHFRSPKLVSSHSCTFRDMTFRLCPCTPFDGRFPKLGYNDGERGYIDLVTSLLDKVDTEPGRADRTQVGTYSKFGPQLEFDLEQGFPLLTSKRVPFKMVAKELLFFISGSTDATKLAGQNVHIWDGNTTREFLDNRGLKYSNGDPYVVGDMGPMYGFQWRHAGAKYRGCKAVYTDQGVDQIKQIETLLREDPTSRRIILSAHNVPVLDQMALHPCHSMFQLYVADGKLSGKLTQRSADIFLGVPFNIASYALLIHMFARVTGLKVGKLIMSFGDVHLYKSHVEAAQKMIDTGISSAPIAYPTLEITGDQSTMDDFKLENFAILNYCPGPTIRAPMAV